MFKIVIMVSNIMGPKTKPPNLMQLYSIAQELEVISILSVYPKRDP